LLVCANVHVNLALGLRSCPALAVLFCASFNPARSSKTYGAHDIGC
jgi:hypothetical protein